MWVGAGARVKSPYLPNYLFVKKTAIMRLSKLQIAGFKSFVDPTDIRLPADLVAVVGPNGCGKSNIIDAVRWVPFA